MISGMHHFCRWEYSISWFACKNHQNHIVSLMFCLSWIFYLLDLLIAFWTILSVVQCFLNILSAGDLVYIILYYIILYYIILYHIALYYIILYYVILYYIILYYVILCYIMLYYVILCYIMLYYDIWYLFVHILRIVGELFVALFRTPAMRVAWTELSYSEETPSLVGMEAQRI